MKRILALPTLALLTLCTISAHSQMVPVQFRIGTLKTQTMDTLKQAASEAKKNTGDFVDNGVRGATEIIRKQNAKGVPLIYGGVTEATAKTTQLLTHAVLAKIARGKSADAARKATEESSGVTAIGGLIQACGYHGCGVIAPASRISVIQTTVPALPRLITPITPPKVREIYSLARPATATGTVATCSNCGSLVLSGSVSSDGKSVATSLIGIIGGRPVKASGGLSTPNIDKGVKALGQSAAMKNGMGMAKNPVTGSEGFRISRQEANELVLDFMQRQARKAEGGVN